MIPFKLSELLKNLEIKMQYDQDALISHITIDSRACIEGSLFIAINGENNDGHNYVKSAVENGAKIIIVEKNIELQDKNIVCIKVKNTIHVMAEIAKLVLRHFAGKIISLTGSCGKTTTKQMLASICAQQFNTQSTKGNFNNFIGVPLTVFDVEQQHDILIAELGANAKKEIQYLNSIVNPNVAILLNASAAHLDGFEDLESVIKTKGEIITSSDQDAIIVLNKDDPSFSQWLNSAGEKQVVTFSSVDSTADVFIKQANYLSDRSEFTVSVFDRDLICVLKAPGKHNVQNALAAISAASSVGVSDINIIKGIHLFENCKGRLQSIQIENVSIWDDTYNANPASIKSAVDVLELQNGLNILVLGDMAEMDSHIEQYSQELKKYISNKVDFLFTVGNQSKLISSDLESAKHFIKQQELVEYIIQLIKLNSASQINIMVKGSRSAKMENVVSQLTLCLQENRNDLLVN
ncbi:UDP-N-acetylmuramoyl-tripeptide--D-alanyl-D-alanine ligase [Marinicellulosiphila megalodicopiae]|uniref:UDP-N-acetylmuramoyl-tripeptide--D-alanyl-D- alanine ligase n=1 Tax=Marinicellulosiphila megalodicopiae TaxID=2724896 RepID=UPI003BB1BCAB